MAERKEPFGATTAAIVSGLFVLFIDKLLPLEKFFGELPIIPRALLALAAGLFVWKGLGLLGTPRRRGRGARIARTQ
jgi:hypothetical protein